MASTYELIVKTVDQSSRTLNNVDTALQRVGKAARTVGIALAAIGGGNLLRNIVQTTARFEDLRTTLNSVTGSARAGGQAFNFIQSFATRTQFGVEDLTNAYIKLQSAGITPTERLLTTFTDTAAVTTDQLGSLEAITDLFSRTVSGGLGLEELNRLADRGVPIFRILEQQLGLTRLEVSEFGKTAEGAAQIRDALQRGLDASFGGATAGRLGNLSTAMSNFGIAVTNTAAEIGEGLRPALRDVLVDTTALIENNRQLAEQFGVGLGEAIRGTAEAIKFLANNFALIRDVAVTAFFIQGAASATNFIKALRGFRGARDSVGILTRLGQAALETGKKLPIIGFAIGRIARIISFLAGLTPINRIITVGLAAATSAIIFLRDKTFQLGETTTTVSEIARVVFFKIGQLATAAANVLGSVWQNAVTQVTGFFTDGFGANIISVLQSVGSGALTVANAIIGYFIFTYRSIVGIFQNLPAAFVETFKAIGATARDFGTRIVTQFTSIGNALLLAIQAPFSRDIAFQDAFDALTQNAFEGLGDSIRENFSPVTEGLAAALEEAGEALSGNFIEDTFAGYVAAIEATILEFREYEAQLASASAATEVYDDAILRVARGLGVLGSSANEAEAALTPLEQRFNEVVAAATEASNGQELNRQVLALLIQAYRDGTITLQVYNQALAQIGATATQTGQQLSAYQQFLNSTVESASRSAQEIGFASQAQADLRQQLADGRISVDTYAQAMERLNGILGITTNTTSGGAGGGGLAQAIETVNSTYERGIQALADYELKSQNVTGAMQLLERDFANGSITLDQFGIAMQGMGANMDDIQNRSIALGLTLTESFEKAGDGLARGLARGIARGESIMSSFKNFMQSILEDILYQVIQQAFIKPLISSMTAGLSSAFGAFGRGGAGAFGGGGFGSLIGGSFFGPIGGFLGGLLGFANGGVVPGRATAGDSVPILATPGEVILNKQQQAQVMQGGTSEPITVNFNISAIDSRSGTEFILQNKKQITSVIQQAYNTRGRQGPLG